MAAAAYMRARKASAAQSSIHLSQDAIQQIMDSQGSPLHAGRASKGSTFEQRRASSSSQVSNEVTTSHHEADPSNAQSAPLLNDVEPDGNIKDVKDAVPGSDQNQEVHWAESGWFQSLGASVISFNAVLLGLETDIESPYWWYLEQLLLLFFVFELVVRMRRFGLSFLSCSNPDICWNMLDFVIVLSAVLDQWIRPLVIIESKGKSSFGQAMMLMRMLRLMRILRLLRLVKAVRPLYKLAVGIVAAMQSMFWVLVLTFLGIYAFAIFTTRLIGHSQIVDNPDDLDVKSHMQFATIPQSMFTLFEIMTSWSLASISPLLDALPGWRPTFVGFTVFSTWGLLSVMAGLVSENIINATHNWQEKERELSLDVRDNDTADRWNLLYRLFDTSAFVVEEPHVLDELDSPTLDESGVRKPRKTLKLQHLEYLIEIPEWVAAYKKQSTRPLQDLLQLFSWLDVFKEGSVEIMEFVDGFMWMVDSMNNRSVLKLLYDLHKSEKSSNVSATKEFQKAFQDMEALNTDAIRTHNSIDHAQQVWCQHIEEMLEPKLVAFEHQLSAQVRSASERVERAAVQILQ